MGGGGGGVDGTTGMLSACVGGLEDLSVRNQARRAPTPAPAPTRLPVSSLPGAQGGRPASALSLARSAARVESASESAAARTQGRVWAPAWVALSDWADASTAVTASAATTQSRGSDFDVAGIPNTGRLEVVMTFHSGRERAEVGPWLHP